GNWQLEAASGPVEARLPFAAETLTTYHHALKDVFVGTFATGDPTAITGAAGDVFKFSSDWGSRTITAGADSTLDFNGIGGSLKIDVASNLQVVVTQLVTVGTPTNVATAPSNIKTIIGSTKSNITLNLSTLTVGLEVTIGYQKPAPATGTPDTT